MLILIDIYHLISADIEKDIAILAMIEQWKL